MLTTEQLAERTSYLGASEAAAILGLDEWKTPMEVWAEKTKKLPHEDLGDKMCIKLGNALEEFVARQFTEETGKKVHRVNATLRHPKYPFIACNLDREVYGEQVPLECKTAGEFMADEWKGEDAPTKYLVQVYHQMAVTGAPYAYLAVLIGNRDFKWLKVERDEKHIEAIVEREVKFWKEFVEPGVMPKVTRNDADALQKLYADAVDEVIGLGDDARRLVESLQAMKSDAKVLDGSIDRTANELKAMLGNKIAGTTGDYHIFWKPTTTTRIDTDKIRTEQPELVKQYLTTTTYRRFTTKHIKGKK